MSRAQSREMCVVKFRLRKADEKKYLQREELVKTGGLLI